MLAQEIEILQINEPDRNLNISEKSGTKITDKFMRAFAKRNGLSKYIVQNNEASLEYRRQNGVECDICCKKFSFKNVLVKHRSRVHFSFLNDTEEKQFECDICCKKFRFESDMERHRNSIHLSFLK